MNAHKTRKVSIEAHPAGLVILSVAGTLIAIRVLMHAPPQDLSASLWIGLGVWLPALLFEKWFLRRFRDFYAEFFISPFEERVSWRMEKINLLSQTPIVLGIVAVFILARGIASREYSGLSFMWVLSILAYPEQKAIYEAAKARLAEDRRHNGTDA